MTADGRPRRLSLLGIVTGFVTRLPQYAVTLIAVGAGVRLASAALVIPVLAAVVAMLGLVIPFLAWRRFTYAVGTDEVRIDSGLFSRTQRSIPFDRIQDVAVERRPVHRLFGLAVVHFETGAAGEDEGKLDAVSVAEAERLRGAVRASKLRTEGVAGSEQAAPPPDPAPLFAMGTGRVLLAGLFNFSLFLVALLFGAYQQVDNFLPWTWHDLERWARAARDSDILRHAGLTGDLIAIAAAAATLLAVGFASGIVRTLLTEHGFRLDRTEAGFRRRRGLLTLTDVVLPVARIQAAMIDTGPVRRRFGWHALRLQSLGRQSAKEPIHDAAPFARLAEIAAILRGAGLPMPPPPAAFTRVDPRPALITAAIAALVLVAGTVIGNSIGSPLGLWPLCALPVIIVGFVLGWRHRGFAIADDALFIRSGLWRRRIAILPMVRTQSVDRSQGPLLRLLGLARLTIGVAGGSGSAFTIDAVPDGIARSLGRQLIGAAAAVDWAGLSAPDVASPTTLANVHPVA